MLFTQSYAPRQELQRARQTLRCQGMLYREIEGAIVALQAQLAEVDADMRESAAEVRRLEGKAPFDLEAEGRRNAMLIGHLP